MDNSDKSYSCSISLDKCNSRQGNIEIIASAKDDYTIRKLTGDLSQQAHENIVDYISLLKQREGIAILMSVKGEAAEYTRGDVFNAIRSLGIDETLSGHEGTSFFAVVDLPSIVYESSNQTLEYDGILIGDETPFHIKSFNKYVDNDCSIMIDGKEYADQQRGFNFVIYDYESGSVIDTAAFNVSPQNANRKRCSINSEINQKTALLTVSNIVGDSELDLERASVRGVMWDGKHKHYEDIGFSHE